MQKKLAKLNPEYGDMNADGLRQELKKRGLDDSGKKIDLIKRLTDALNAESEAAAAKRIQAEKELDTMKQTHMAEQNVLVEKASALDQKASASAKEVEAAALTGHRFDLALGCAHPLLRPSGLPAQRVLVVHDRASLPTCAGHVRRRRLRVRLGDVPWKGRRRRQCGHRAIISALASGGLQRGLHGS